MGDDEQKRARVIMNAETINRVLRRIAHEIIERHTDVGRLILAGIHTRGVPLAHRLAEIIEGIEGHRPRVGAVELTFFRDDFRLRAKSPEKYTEMPSDVDESEVVLVDDVCWTGRSTKAAIDAVMTFGRPGVIELAVLIDRNGRELPIRADYVGREFLQTQPSDRISVHLREIDGEDQVLLIGEPETT